MKKGIFQSSIRGPDGEVDSGYLGLAVVTALVLGAIPSAVILVTARMIWVEGHPLDLVGLAAVIGACGGCYGAAAAGVGLFRAGDKDVVTRRFGPSGEHDDDRDRGDKCSTP